MSSYIFEYSLPKGYYLKIISHFVDADISRAYLYKGRHYFPKLINVKDFDKHTPKLEIVKESIKFLELLEKKEKSKTILESR